MKVWNSAKSPIWNTWEKMVLPNVLKLFQNCFEKFEKNYGDFSYRNTSHTFFTIFLINRVLWRKIFLIVCFSPCYLDGKNKVSGEQNCRSNWTLSPCGIFFIIVLGTTSNGRTKKKWIWEIRNALVYSTKVQSKREKSSENLENSKIFRKNRFF